MPGYRRLTDFYREYLQTGWAVDSDELNLIRELLHWLLYNFRSSISLPEILVSRAIFLAANLWYGGGGEILVSRVDQPPASGGEAGVEPNT
jgi:hypothetical protein